MKHTVYNKPGSKGLRLLACLCFTLFFTTAAPAALAVTKQKNQKDDVNQIYIQIEKEMETTYNNGNLKGVIEIYNEKCSKEEKGKPGKEKKMFKKVSKRTRADIYRWVFLSYSALDRQEKADIFLKKYLVIRRREGVGKTWLFLQDRARSLYLVAPRWLVGLKTGTNLTIVQSEPFSVLEPLNDDNSHENDYEKKYDSKLAHRRGMQIGIIIEYCLTKNLSICVQPTLTQQQFRYGSDFIWGIDYTEMNFVHTQKLTNIELPVLLKYRFSNLKLKPYIQAGGFYSILSSANKILESTIIQRYTTLEDEIEHKISDEAHIDIKEQLKSSYIGLWAGVGIGFNIGRGIHVEVEVNYKYRNSYIVDENQRYKNEKLLLEYYDVFDDMKLTNWELNLKILLPVSFKAFKR